MITDELGKQLHDRVTRGERLSKEEEAWLEAWYAFQDQAEEQALGLMTEPQTQILKSLQRQTETALAQLMVAAGRIQEISAENEAIRKDIILLRQQLAKQVISHPVR